MFLHRVCPQNLLLAGIQKQNLDFLDEITEYFGVKIGMYFAWLGHYTTALSIPAIVGFFFWVSPPTPTQAPPSLRLLQLCCNGKHQTLEDVGYVLFSVFNVVWVTTYLQAWKRYSAELAFRWGTLDQRDDLLAEPRPLFRVRPRYYGDG